MEEVEMEEVITVGNYRIVLHNPCRKGLALFTIKHILLV